jgi:small subunit ribosomal protein S20
VARSLSSRKRVRQNERRAARNQSRKSVLKKQVVKARDALAANDVNAAASAVRAATVVLDRAATLGTIHRNTAARRKSRLAKRLNALKTVKK